MYFKVHLYVSSDLYPLSISSSILDLMGLYGRSKGALALFDVAMMSFNVSHQVGVVTECLVTVATFFVPDFVMNCLYMQCHKSFLAG